MKYICIILFLFFTSTLSAQVSVDKDPRVDLLLKKQEEVNKKVWTDNNNNKQVPGFRVLVINTNNRQSAIDVKTKLMRDFPEHKTYMLYQSPNFRVQIGNFRTRKEADLLKNQLAKIYSSGLLIISATIEVKQEEEPVQ